MPVTTTERKTAQTLEDVLSGQLSDEQTEVSEEPVTKEGQEGEPKAEKESVAKEEKAEEPPKFQWSKEQEAEIQRRIDSERDKHTNSYREKREADTALIRSLNTQNKELRLAQIEKAGNKRIEAILAGDEEAGIDPDVSRTRQQALQEINEQYKEYTAKSAEVEEAAQVIGKMTENLPKNIVKEFGLDDANFNIRAVNGVKFLEETFAVYKNTQNFLLTLEHFLPKGDELRKQLDEIASGLSEFENEKSKLLYLKDKLAGVKVIRKKPPTPSDAAGGADLSKLTLVERIARAL